jgi:hypothetical protein
MGKAINASMEMASDFAARLVAHGADFSLYLLHEALVNATGWH